MKTILAALAALVFVMSIPVDAQAHFGWRRWGGGFGYATPYIYQPPVVVQQPVVVLPSVPYYPVYPAYTYGNGGNNVIVNVNPSGGYNQGYYGGGY